MFTKCGCEFLHGTCIDMCEYHALDMHRDQLTEDQLERLAKLKKMGIDTRLSEDRVREILKELEKKYTIEELYAAYKQLSFPYYLDKFREVSKHWMKYAKAELKGEI